MIIKSNIVLVVDTCVWMELAKQPTHEPIVSYLKHLSDKDIITILLPDEIGREFSRNKDRLIAQSKQRLTQEIRRVRGMVEQYSTPNEAELVIPALNNVHHKLPMMSDKVTSVTTEIENIISSSLKIEPSNSVLLNAAERARSKLAPFHRGKNSFADAIIIETFHELAMTYPEKEFHFVSLNIHDFSDNEDHRKPHSDFTEIFKSDSVNYDIQIFELLKEIGGDDFEFAIEDFEWDQESRGLYEILDELSVLADKMWYGRHLVLKESIENGEVRVLPKSEYKGGQKEILDTIWEGALQSGIQMKERYSDDEQLGEWDGFEWGILNGKISALRWVLGEDWDELYT